MRLGRALASHPCIRLIPACQIALISALQQARIYGLTSWDSPIPPMLADQTHSERRAGGVILLRSVMDIVCAARIGRDQDQKQGA